MDYHVRKNVLIAEILYIVFLHYKGLGNKYPYFTLRNDMRLCLALLEIMKKQNVDIDDKITISKGIKNSLKYCPVQENTIDLNDIIVDELISDEPLSRMEQLIDEIMKLSERPFNRKDICKKMFALHNLPRAYLSKTTYYLIDHKAAVSVKDAVKYSLM